MTAETKKDANPNPPNRSGSFDSKFFNVVEKIGNSFPQPFLLFIYCAVTIIIISELAKGITFQIPGEDTQLVIISLMNREGFVYILSNLLKNFINFPLIPLIFFFTIAIGVGDKSGFFKVLIMTLFRRIPDAILYFVFIFI